MKKQTIAEKCKEFLEPVISGLGYELVDVDWKKEYGEDNLTVYIDKPENFVSPFEEDDDISENSIVDFDDDNKVTNAQKNNQSAKVITLKDCEYVHKVVDEKLDELDPTGGKPYILNISSCGADWAFRSNRDYQKNIGNVVEVSLFDKVEGKKYYEGILQDFTENSITITLDKKQIQIERKNIAKICKHIDF